MNKEQISRNIQDLNTKSFKKVVVFLNSTKCYRYDKCKYSYIFWQSELPIKWVNEISKTLFKWDLLYGYFSSPSNVNPKFLEAISQTSPDFLIKIIKLDKAFVNESHWESFEVFKSNKNLKLKILFKELSFIRTFLAEWKEKAKYYNSIIEQFDYEDILIHVISYYEKFKRSSQRSSNNRSHIISMEMNLNYVLNEMLNIKKEINITEKAATTNKYNVSKFASHVNDTLPPKNPVDGTTQGRYIPHENITDEKRIIREAIEFHFAFHGNKHQIDKYLSGFAEFEFIDKKEAGLRTNEYFSIYQRNDMKSNYAEMLFYNKASENTIYLNQVKNKKDSFDKEILLNHFFNKEYYNFLKLPHKYNTKYNGTIDFEKVFKLLKVFSLYLMPSGRFAIFTDADNEKEQSPKEPISIIRSKPSDFKEYFKEGYIICFDEKELIFNCEMYFNWDKQELINIIDYLTTDLSADWNLKIDILKKPIIKIGSQYIWLSSLLRDRAWNIIMHRRIVSDKLNKHNEQSIKMEKQIANDFINAGFKAVSSHCYKTDTYNGEIDVVAYKDKTLFLIELKTSYIEENLIRSAKYKIQNLNKAEDQLSKAMKYIDNNFDEIIKIEELNIDCIKSDLHIQPLIISNIYVADDIFINNKILKISLFELMVILNNDLYNMLNLKTGKTLFNSDIELPIPTMMQMNNQFAHDFKNDKIKTDKEKCNLWENNNNCTANDLISAIKNNKVWSFLDELREFNYVESIELNQFNPNEKILI